jgi:hypothetical protein
MRDLDLYIKVRDAKIEVTGEGLHFLGNRLIDRINHAILVAARQGRRTAIRDANAEIAKKKTEEKTTEANIRRLTKVLKSKTDEVK